MDELRRALYELCKSYDHEGTDIDALASVVGAAERPGASLRERPSFHERVAYRLHERLACRGSDARALLGLAVDARRRALVQALGEIDAIVGRDGLDVLALKGFAIEALYPDGYTRQFGDIDLLVEDAATAWRLVAALQDEDFASATEPPLMYGLPSATGSHVLVKLSRPDGAKVEVASGAASNGPLPTGMSWGELRRTSVPSPRAASLRIPGPEATVALFLVELYERRALFVRDLCDWDVLCRNLETHGTVEELSRLIDALNLRPSLRRLNRESDAVAGMSPRWQSLLGGRGRGIEMPLALGYWWGYGLPFLARRLGRRDAVAGVVRGWLDYSLRRSRLPGSDGLRLRLESRIDPVERLRTPGLPVYLVRLGDAPAGMRRTDAPRWLPSAEGGRSLLATPAGVYLPSAYLTLREHELAAAQRTAEALAVT